MCQPQEHTAKTKHTAYYYLCRVLSSKHTAPRARATHVRRWRTEVDGGATEVDGAQLCLVPHGAHGKQTTSPCAKAWHTANRPLRRVLKLGTRQTRHFVVCFFLAHGKQFENFEFSNSKFFLHCRDIAWYSILKFGIFVVMFTIYKNYVSVKRIFQMSQILNCKYIK